MSQNLPNNGWRDSSEEMAEWLEHSKEHFGGKPSASGTEAKADHRPEGPGSQQERPHEPLMRKGNRIDADAGKPDNTVPDNLL
jgi:hypothetical protein